MTTQSIRDIRALDLLMSDILDSIEGYIDLKDGERETLEVIIKEHFLDYLENSAKDLEKSKRK